MQSHKINLPTNHGVSWCLLLQLFYLQECLYSMFQSKSSSHELNFLPHTHVSPCLFFTTSRQGCSHSFTPLTYVLQPYNALLPAYRQQPSINIIITQFDPFLQSFTLIVDCLTQTSPFIRSWAGHHKICSKQQHGRFHHSFIMIGQRHLHLFVSSILPPHRSLATNH